MDQWLAMALAGATFFGFLVIGAPIFVSLGLAGAIGTILFVGITGLSNLGDAVFGSIWHVSLLAAPGFIFMGSVFFQHGFGRDLFNAAEAWLGRLPGGLVVSAIWLGAGFGFICGSNMAGVATVGQIAIPEVERRGYDRRLSLGAFAIAGSLAALIPPSLLMIIYAVLAEVSLGALFFAGIIPGLLLTGLLSGYVILRAVMNPALCPPENECRRVSHLAVAKGVFPLALCFFVIFGGIYAGLWSVIEASGAGAALAVALCVVYGRFSVKGFTSSLDTTVKILGLVYMIVVAASLFNHFVFISSVPIILTSFVTSLDMEPWLIMVMILLIITALGFILDLYAMLLISIPVFLPVSTAIGYDPLWFGIILIIAAELALVTPPVGLNLFIIKRIAPPGTKILDIALGALPYVLVVWVLFGILIAFPELVLWLPEYVRS
ncbi:MAG: TRAP transporter large permease [Mesorhizobium sp.]|nr:TRAP transporter large permease [Mesorhizobium sp.]